MRQGAHTIDPRLYQAAVQAGLLVYGLLFLGFDLTGASALATIGASLLTQYLCTRLFGLPAFEPRSALNTALSLCLLFRCTHWGVAAAIAAVSIASKFALRWHGKHLFNPSNFGIVLALLLGIGWVSPAQWGQWTLFAFLLAAAGLFVVTRAARWDVSLAFLLTYITLVFGRSLWLGDPLTIPAHRLQNGALVLYSFFMISDPRTTPDARPARLLFGALVAFGAWYWQFRLFHVNGLMYALFAVSLLTPLFDRLWPAPRFDWKEPLLRKGNRHEDPAPAADRLLPRPAA